MTRMSAAPPPPRTIFAAAAGVSRPKRRVATQHEIDRDDSGDESSA